jgi:endonuclease/exonuclease/phosphatase family metal-dependent hydrolase
MRVLTCNVRYSAAKDGENNWMCRKELCLRGVRQQNADLICCQEMSAEQQRAFAIGLPEYEWFGMVDLPHNDTPVNSIFYRRERFRRISVGGYWLSKTPHIPGSSSWDSSVVRLCNWLRLVDLPTGREFRLVNTHIDHISQPARVHQMGMILEEAKAYLPDYPQILTGDLNCNASNAVIKAILKAGWVDSYQAIHGVLNPGNTFHAFHGPDDPNQSGKIDWIFTRGDVQARAAEIITIQENGRYPSDHYFISADLEWLAPTA